MAKIKMLLPLSAQAPNERPIFVENQFIASFEEEQPVGKRIVFNQCYIGVLTFSNSVIQPKKAKYLHVKYMGSTNKLFFSPYLIVDRFSDAIL